MRPAIRCLLDELGPAMVRLAPDIPDRNRADVAGFPPTCPAALVLPASVSDLSRALAICHRYDQPVAVQGGMTGAAGGGHPDASEVALSTERLAGVEEVDPVSATLTALAGTPLQIVQEAAATEGLFCGIDIGSRGTATIGGIAATNAGGNQVLRYGMARANILGLEAVLADGTVVSALHKVLKNNTGYDWTQLLIGSEGTLGVVTRVLLRLHPRPRGVRTAFLAIESTTGALRLLRRLQAALPGGLLVFEAMWREFYGLATGPLNLRAPVGRDGELCLLIEAEQGELEDRFETALAACLADGLMTDVVIAKSETQREAMWAIRESSYLYQSKLSAPLTFDLSFPPNRLVDAIERLRALMPSVCGQSPWSVFGHLADGNVHVCLMPSALTHDIRLAANDLTYLVTSEFDGSISAEHGIGRLKRDYLQLSRSEEELALMRSIKSTLDPKGILGPGRVFRDAPIRR